MSSDTVRLIYGSCWFLQNLRTTFLITQYTVSILISIVSQHGDRAKTPHIPRNSVEPMQFAAIFSACILTFITVTLIQNNPFKAVKDNGSEVQYYGLYSWAVAADLYELNL